MKQNNYELLGTMEIKKLLMKLSIPAILGMVVNALYNFVDTLFVAKGVGELAIGGLALAFPIQMIVMAIALMIGMGSASIFSRAYGRKDQQKMDDAVNTALRLGLLGSVLMTVIGIVFLDELLVFFGATASNVVYASDYLSVILIGLVPLSLTMILNNLTRAEGRAEIAMISMMIGTGLNIILDPIFIFDFGLGMGVKGAAIATIISQFVAFLFIAKMAFHKNSALRIRLGNWLKVDAKTVWETLVIGLPSFLRNAIGAFLAIIIYRLINRYADGDPAIYISIYGVINRIMTFVFMPGFGIIQGLSPIVGFSFGAKNFQRLKDVIVYATKIIVVYFAFGFLFIQFFSSSIFRLFGEGDSSFFIDYGANAFRIVAIGFLVVGFQIVVSAVYQSVGYPVRAMVVALSRQVLFFIPLAYILSSVIGIPGIWWSFVGADVLAGIVSFILLFTELKSIHKKIDQSMTLVNPIDLDAPTFEIAA
jgi:putative MATE family efflux protein